jgi:acetyltransferase-like isoleucine patch superfamily enzyme
VSRLHQLFSRQAWRQRALRSAFARHGAGPGAAHLRLIGTAPHLKIAGRIELDQHVTFRCVIRPTAIYLGAGATLKIGAHSYFNQGCNVAIHGGLTLGRHCLVAEEEVSFFDTNYHEVDQGSGVLSSPIVIGDNVWIGHGAIVLPGAIIGDHSVIAAGAVVRGEFPARSLIAGVPARLIRTIRCGDDFFRT